MTKEKPSYMFTANWFDINIPIWNAALEEYKNKDDLSYLEIGVFEGRSFFWMLDNILTGKNITATAIDAFIYTPSEDTFTKNLNLCRQKECVTVHKGISHEILKKFDDNSFNIIYVDGSHKSRDVLHDIVVCWNLLKKGGLLLLDDYFWKINEFPINLTPKLAIDSFLTIYSDELELLYRGYSMVIRKKNNPLFMQDFSFINNNIYFWESRTLYHMVNPEFNHRHAFDIFYQSKSWGELDPGDDLAHIALNDEEITVLEKYLKLLGLGGDKPDESKLPENDLTVWKALKKKIQG